MRELVLATGNAGKIKELTQLLYPINTIPQSRLNIDSVEETGMTFVENALLKARHASEQCQKPVLADDSGLVVNALQGQPGIHSSRFAGERASDTDNIALLLQKMQFIPDAQREAYFYCAIVIVRHANDPMPIIALGQVDGLITRQPEGEQGFGYDPIFFLPSENCTMAQLPAELKNQLSHRGRALQQLRHQLDKL